MSYEIRSTETFRCWLDGIRDVRVKRRLLARIDRLGRGNFGDYKQIGTRLYELRLFFGAGYRMYYTVEGDSVVLLLVGGDKSTQTNDIARAQSILTSILDDLR